MKTPEHPLGPAFEKAADAIEAWRQQQIAALTDEQRRIFEDVRRKADERQKAKAKELAARRQADIEAKMRKKLLETPLYELKMPRGHRTITKVLADQLIAQHFQGGLSPDYKMLTMLVRGARQWAEREVERDHEWQRQVFREEERVKTDEVLRTFERAREAQPVHEEFGRAGVADKARTDFEEAARGESARLLKSEAIARAIAAVREKEEEEEKARSDRDQGRSLSDTFNKVR